jgi:hypothetical protein
MAQAAQRGERFAGLIEIAPMPVSLRQQFEESKEIL